MRKKIGIVFKKCSAEEVTGSLAYLSVASNEKEQRIYADISVVNYDFCYNTKTGIVLTEKKLDNTAKEIVKELKKIGFDNAKVLIEDEKGLKIANENGEVYISTKK